MVLLIVLKARSHRSMCQGGQMIAVFWVANCLLTVLIITWQKG